MPRNIRLKYPPHYDGYTWKQSVDEECLALERRRLKEGPAREELCLGMEIDAHYVYCAGNAPEVMRWAIEIMTIVNGFGMEEDWGEDPARRELLPVWFRDKWRYKDPASRADGGHDTQLPSSVTGGDLKDDEWSFEKWAGNMEAVWRDWFWFNATCLDENRILLDVERPGDPASDAMKGSVWRLFKACGATGYMEIESGDEYFPRFL